MDGLFKCLIKCCFLVVFVVLFSALTLVSLTVEVGTMVQQRIFFKDQRGIKR